LLPSAGQESLRTRQRYIGARAAKSLELGDVCAVELVKRAGADEMLADLVREMDIDVVMLAGRYTLLEQDSLDDLLPVCEERLVGVVAAGVFNSGLLARPQPPSEAKYDFERAPTPDRGL